MKQGLACTPVCCTHEREKMGYRVVVAVLATGIACGGMMAGARMARAQDLPASPAPHDSVELHKLPPYQNKVNEYIDLASIQLHGAHSSATFIQDFDEDMIRHGLPFASVRFSVVYNCAADTYRTLSYATWSGHMGTGHRIADGPVPRGEMTVDPSLRDGRQIACARWSASHKGAE
ncbi:hypothetical protein D3W54_08945 [Komagataeibacter medellinensis]|uniref:Surface-adhesin protein E-like domain-containing protein n=2 Tax=Komagataeibacter medellinensis TaxID=1177712 RepID=A0ABQ6VZ24_9PROT|nr:hypothetical protein D3W54_08945 [Komagataeibacter medellinensis]